MATVEFTCVLIETLPVKTKNAIKNSHINSYKLLVIVHFWCQCKGPMTHLLKNISFLFFFKFTQG